jgi:hypothetical protein
VATSASSSRLAECNICPRSLECMAGRIISTDFDVCTICHYKSVWRGSQSYCCGVRRKPNVVFDVYCERCREESPEKVEKHRQRMKHLYADLP